LVINNALLKEMAASCGIGQLGVVSAAPLLYTHRRLQRRLDENRSTPFEENNPAKRLSPATLPGNYRSIITVAIPYAAPEKPMPFKPDQPRGKVARCARGIDYHRLVEEKSFQLAKLIANKSTAEISYRVLCDRSPLLERELAFKAKLGLIGENCTLINPRYGSYVTLGTILVDREIEPEHPAPLKKHCLRCGACRRACPTGAITEPYILNPHLCLSYLTQASGIFPRELRAKLGQKVYGCDCCQEACPLNNKVESSPYRELAFSFFPAEPLLHAMLTMTQKEFKMTIELTSAGWRGKTTLQRNAVIAAGNSGNKTMVPLLTRLLQNDTRPVIRLHTAWALGKLGGAKARFALGKARQNDPEDSVKKEAHKSLLEQE